MKSYPVTVLWSDEDLAFIAVCAAFPGVSAFGDTEKQAREEMAVAMELATEFYADNGWELPDPL